MKGFLVYKGGFPRFALKRDWDAGSKLNIEEVYRQFKARCVLTDKLDPTFVRWFKDSYVSKLGPDFELVTDEDVLPSTSNKILVESSNVEVAASLDDATNRLRSLRHTDEVGHIESEIPTMPAARTKLAEIKALQDAPEVVMTGDDLERHTSRAEDTQRRGTAFTLSEMAESIATTPSSKDDRDRVNRQLAEVSKGVKVLTEEILTGGDYKSPATSRIMVGGSNNTETADVTPKANLETGSDKKNRYFQGHQAAFSKPEVAIEDIVNAPSKEDSINMINQCKSHSVLKVAKSYLRETGNQALVELIERRLRNLPPFSN